MLGEARICHSCSRKTLILELKPIGCSGAGLYVRCFNPDCGFRELVWWPGCGGEALRNILVKFGVNPLSLPPCLRRIASGTGSLEEPPREVL